VRRTSAPLPARVAVTAPRSRRRKVKLEFQIRLGSVFAD
jgi:hypothetical protein